VTSHIERMLKRAELSPGLKTGGSEGRLRGVPGLSPCGYSIPGLGLYERQKLSGGAPVRAVEPRSKVNVELTIGVQDDGTVTFRDGEGQPVSEAMIVQAKKQQGDAIRTLIHRACEGVNSQVSVLGELHHDTPPPNTPPTYRAGSFDVPKPRPAVPRVPGFIEGLFKSKRTKIEQENARAEARYQSEVAEWGKHKADFEAAERRKQALIASAVAGEVAAMEEFLGEVLQDIVWPRETAVSFEVLDGGARLAFDVDLPEVEGMPTKTASVPQRGYKLSLKAMSQTAVQKLYAQHVHSIAFRLLGEAFGVLPTLQVVTLSGYSQRKDKATGHEQDDYLLSVSVPRSAWERLNFSALRDLDVVEALERLGARREMSKTGVFKAIAPL